MTLVSVNSGTGILLRGQVTDGLTRAGLAARLTLEWDQGAGFRPFPLPLQARPDGWFAIAARLSQIAARLRIGHPLTLRLQASRPGYQPGVLTRNLSAAQFSRATETVTVEGEAFSVDRIAAAPIVMDIGLLPSPVMLAGQVLTDNDPLQPVSGARVRITGPGGSSVLTAANGRFRIDAPPLLRSWPLRITKGTRSAVATHVTDFASPVNFITINLPNP